MNTDRISISEKENSTSILIFSKKEKSKQLVLLTWIVLWSIGGFIVFTQVFKSNNNQERLFLIVWLAFWLYFELITLNAFLWRKYGVERILIKEGKFYYTKEIKNKGKTQVFEMDNISSFNVLDSSKENSFVKNIKESYWVIGGETLEFNYGNKQVKWGLQLENKDAQRLYTLVDKKLKKYK